MTEIEIAIWEKGKVVAGGNRGVNPLAWRELERETGRDHKDLKRWFELYERYPVLERFLKEYGKPRAEAWTRKALGAHLMLKSVETPVVPAATFAVIYADPPWEYEFSQSNSRGIPVHYRTMSLEQIRGLRIPAAEDAVLFLWATAPKLTEALEVMQAWGFTYRTDAVWDKERIGMGYWFRGQRELLLVGTRGSVPWLRVLRCTSLEMRGSLILLRILSKVDYALVRRPRTRRSS